jgi:hypothetical protein
LTFNHIVPPLRAQFIYQRNRGLVPYYVSPITLPITLLCPYYAVRRITPRLKEIFQSLVEMQNPIDQAAFLERKS